MCVFVKYVIVDQDGQHFNEHIMVSRSPIFASSTVAGVTVSNSIHCLPLPKNALVKGVRF